MRKVTGGNGTDTTAAVAAWLAGGNELRLANLYLIGELEDPNALWLTDWEAPLLWSAWGTFQPAVISRGTVTSKIGLEVSSLDLTWSPKVVPFSQSVSTASPYQLAQIGYYDNRRVRIWTVYMPTPGDANTYGASELFGGRIADSTVERGAIKFVVNSFLDVVNQYVPTNVIELTNTLAAYTAATPPKGFSQIPQFNVITGDSPTQVVGDCTFPSQHHIFGTNDFQHGYLVFNSAPGATLGGMWAAVQQNIKITIRHVDYNQFILYTPLPWAPTPGLDTFYVSRAAPIDQQDGSYYGFPYVPDPSLAV
jgi:Uncharacterized conserved protein (DUF2163)